jgi:LacI family transcriptional regulator
MAVRLKDIARELNVSVITVSKALRGNTDISEATRRRILARMKELDYRPNMTARSLATGQSYIVGLIVPDLLNPFFSELAKSISTALRKRSYGLILSSADDSAEVEQSEIRMMLARGVDALLIASCQSSPEGLAGVVSQQVPFVLLDRPFPTLSTNFVGSNDRAGGRLAAEHLVGLGRKRIAFLGRPENGPEPDRLIGFRDYLSAHGSPLDPSLVAQQPSGSGSGDEAGFRMMKALLDLGAPPDGIFCHNDVMAIGALKAILDAGYRIPQDIAIVGFDNVHYSQYLQIPLTSVDQLTSELGESAANLALELIAQKAQPQPPRSILLSPKLVQRQSSIH